METPLRSAIPFSMETSGMLAFKWSPRHEAGTRFDIQLKVTEIAKGMVLNPKKSISQIACELGFQYPRHFTRLLKELTGYIPNAYRTVS